MDNFFKNQLYKWTYEKIKSNPKKFGGDFSNSLIMYEYLKEFYNDFAVYELEPQLMSILSTASRIKNKLLEKNPHFDFRTKYKAKKKKIINKYEIKVSKGEINYFNVYRFLYIHSCENNKNLDIQIGGTVESTNFFNGETNITVKLISVNEINISVVVPNNKIIKTFSL